MSITTSVFSTIEAMERGWRQGAKPRPDLSPARRELQSVFTAATRLGLETAELVWVAADMVDLTAHAAATLPPYEFSPSVLPWPSALVVLGGASAITLRDADGDREIVEAVQWCAFTDEGRTHWACLLHARHNGVVAPIQVTFLQPGRVVAADHNPTDAHEDEFGLLAVDTPEGDISVGDPEEAQWLARFLCSLWLLVQQRVTVQSTEHPNRADRRRWDDPDREIPDVTVIELRRPASTPTKGDDHEPVDWSHRWIVDGHWRNQYHPSTDSHVPTWIAPYVKGPEDKPLVVKTKIKAWVR